MPQGQQKRSKNQKFSIKIEVKNPIDTRLLFWDKMGTRNGPYTEIAVFQLHGARWPMKTKN